MNAFARACALLSLTALPLMADTLTKTFTVDFFRDVSSRDLKGMATRSDGRLVAGPVLTDLQGALGADLAWSLAPAEKPGTWYVGTGPSGRILEVSVDPAKGTIVSKPWASVEDAQIFALRRLSDGAIVAGGSPRGSLSLLRGGKVVASVFLPADSVFGILELPPSKPGTQGDLLVGTGNPGRIYRVSMDRFEKAGVEKTRLATPAALAAAGITVFGEIRDRNVRSLALLPDRSVLAGSAPDGNVYSFPAAGGPPRMLMENREAEVTDFAVNPDGSFYASIVATTAQGVTRIQRGARPVAAPAQAAPIAPPAPGGVVPSAAPVQPVVQEPVGTLPPVERFIGRAFIVSFSSIGFPEIVVNRTNQSFYRIAMVQGNLLITGGEQGDLFGYDPRNRLSLTYAGSVSAQVNDISPWPGASGRFVLLRNNPAGLSLLDFDARSARSAQTRKLDLGLLSTLGAVRTARIHGAPATDFDIEASASNGGEEIEGWSPWTRMTTSDQGFVSNVGWRSSAPLRGRYVKLRVSLPPSSPRSTAIDKLQWYFLPQDRRPVLTEFRMLDPDFGLVPAVEPQSSPVVSLSQLLSQPASGEKKHANFLNSQVYPSPGYQVFLWTVTDPDGDNLVSSLYLRHQGDKSWIPAVVDTSDNFAQVDTSHLKEGVYYTRLVVKEAAPRPPADRLTTEFETDIFVVDRTPPVILDASAKVVGDRLVVTVHGRDNLSLLAGLELTFNQGDHEATEEPVDGIRDGREETFSIDVPLAKTAGATQVEAALYDAVGNRSTRVLTW